MASKDPEDACNTADTDEETIALRKKRSRRVSFADREITSVHIFNRDDDYETPPDSTPRSSSEKEQEILGLFKDLPDSDDSDDGDDGDVLDGRKPFLRPIQSPSPGGSSINGSATSNDDNFFGPVSADFIQPGRLSDSGASDGQHEVTMDSTAFSMHFHSLVRSESGDLKTPTAVHLAFEEKTPSQVNTPSVTGNIMVLTKAKKLMSQSPKSVNKVSGGGDSNDMSLVGESLHKYDYGKLSPTLEALMAEGNKDLSVVPASDSIDSKSLKGSKVTISDDNRNVPMELHNHVDSEPCNIDKHMSAEGVSVTCIEVDNANGGSITTLIDEMNDDCLSNQNDGPAVNASVAHEIQTPNQLNRERNDFSKIVNGTNMLNYEFPAVNNGTPLNNSIEVLQLDVFTQPESGNLPSTRDGLKENSSEVVRHNSIIHQVSDQRYVSPSAGSISSLSPKQEQVLLDTRNSLGTALCVTPSPKQSGSFLIKDSIRQGGSISFLLKSIYKSKILQPSPSVSALNDRIDNIKLRLSESVSSKTSHFISTMDQSSEGLQVKHVDVPVINLEEQLSAVDLKKEQLKNEVSIDSYGIGTLKGINSLSQELAMRHEWGSDKHTQNGAIMASPTKLVQSVNKGIHLVDRAPFASENNSPLMEIKLDQVKETRDADISDKLVSSPVRRFDHKLSSMVEYHGSLLGNLRQKDQDDKLVPSSRQDNSSIHVVPRDNYFTAVAEERTPSGSNFIEGNSLKDLTQVKRVDDRESYAVDYQNAPEALRNFLNLPRDRIGHKLQSGSPEKNDQSATNITGFAEKSLEGGRDAACIYASPAANRRSTNEQSSQKSSSKGNPTQSPKVKESTWSLSRRDLHRMLEIDNLQPFVAKSAQSLCYNSDLQGTGERCQGPHVLQDPNLAQDVEKSTKRKRTSEEIVLGEAEHTDKTNRIEQTPKVHRVGENNLEFMLECADGNNEGNENNKGGKWMSRTDISLKLSADTNQLLSPFIDKLNIRVVDLLADILVHQQKVNAFQMLCSEIQSQTYDKLSDVRHKRVAETRSLSSRLIYRKAKLQLMHVKHERLLKQQQLLRTGIQESQMLQLNCSRHLSPHAEKNTQANDISCMAANDKATIMKHEVEATERKIRNLTNSFQNYCKLKGEPSSTDTIIVLNEQLKKRTCCRFVRQDMQLWEIDDLLSRNGHHVVVLNYRGFICQRLALNAGPVSNISVSNKLNDIKIMRNFPNMDAFAVFEFVFKTDSANKYVGAKSLAREIQRTSLILSNLLDVVEEVQLAQIEIRSLTQTRFHSSSADHLNLELTYIDFKSSRKLMIDLDMTCLGRGVYPTEVLPHRLQASFAGTETSLCQPLLAEIKAAVDGLRVGYSRILRLCQCVSQVLKTASK